MRTLLTFFLALIGTSLVAADVSAQQRPPARAQQVAQQSPRGGSKQAVAEVTVDVMVVHATEESAFMDPKLKELERYLQHLKYQSYRVLRQNTTALSKDESKKIAVEGDWEVTITLLSATSDKARFRVQVGNKRGNLADITVAAARNRTMVVSGPQYNGGILLIPITARF